MSDKEKTNGSLAMAPRVITIPAANQETARKLRVAAYTRVSSNSKDQEHSFAAQNAYFSKLITDNPDWELADIYADQGITGTSIDKRDDFLRMMEDCRKGRIDRILVKSSSRFARNTKESLAAVRELKSLNISVYFDENVNSKCEKNIKKYNQASRANSSRHSANTISAVFQPNISRG
mgnify:CR=1 FL=1